MAPFVPTWKTTAPGPASRTTARSCGSGASASLTRAAASRTAAPLEMAIATARRNADSRSDGRFTAAAAYVRPVSSRTAAPSAAATRARAERARVMIFSSSVPGSPTAQILDEHLSRITVISQARSDRNAAGARSREEPPRGGRERAPGLGHALAPVRRLPGRRAWLRVRHLPLDGHRADLVPPAGQALRGQRQPGHGGHRSGDGHPAERVGEQAAHRLHVLGVDADPEQVL